MTSLDTSAIRTDITHIASRVIILGVRKHGNDSTVGAVTTIWYAVTVSVKLMSKR